MGITISASADRRHSRRCHASCDMKSATCVVRHEPRRPAITASLECRPERHRQHRTQRRAAAEGNLHILPALRDWNIDLSATTNDGSNVAHIAARSGYLDVPALQASVGVTLRPTVLVGFSKLMGFRDLRSRSTYRVFSLMSSCLESAFSQFKTEIPR